MLITPHPIWLNQRLSDRVEKRGPWITTTVPPSRMSRSCERPVSSRICRSSEQYGSAAETCVVTGPS